MEPVCMSTNTIPHGYNNGVKDDFPEQQESCGSADDCNSMFTTYDQNRDGFLDYQEFSMLLRDVFHTERDSPITEERIRTFMSLLDSNKDGLIDMEEFKHAWAHCFTKILRPVVALIVVDVQYDFIDGSLALRNCPARQDGSDVVPVINKLIKDGQFDAVVYSLDWHPKSHISFVDNVAKYPLHHTCQKTADEYSIYEEVMFDLSPPRSQILWPAHCIQDSEGAKLHSNLTIASGAVSIYKGTKDDIDSYSAFFDNMRLSQTSMQQELQQRNVTDVYICGLAYDICVAATSRDAVDLGYRTVVIDDACRGVNHDDITASKEQLKQLGAVILESDEAIKSVNKTVGRNFELALFTARRMPALVST